RRGLGAGLRSAGSTERAVGCVHHPIILLLLSCAIMRRALTIALPFLLLSACASAGDHGSDLADSSWEFTAIDGDTPASDKAMLTFEGDRIGANVGCNGMGGPWRLEGGRLIAGPLVQ